MADLDPTPYIAALWMEGADPTCASCGLTQWEPGPVTKLPELDADTDKVNFDNGEPAFSLICSTCGFIRLHAITPSLDERTLGTGGNGAAG